MFVLLDDVAYHGLLSPSQAIVLRHLMDRSEDYVSARDLAAALWGHREDGGGAEGTVYALVHALRFRLRPGFHIKHTRGFGYRIVVQPEVFERELLRMLESALRPWRRAA